MTKERWTKLLTLSRRKDAAKSKSSTLQSTSQGEELPTPETRTEAERDYDRILFSAPVRRLADKTQVFPLDRNDSVRTRLTHSHEVSNLARSIGVGLVYVEKTAEGVQNAERNIPSILAAVGLAHDLGNPPFGHQGEEAIRAWFNRNIHQFKGERELPPELLNDFLIFEGNAQSLRLLTRLQLLDNEFGLDLNVATLAALMKYTTDSSSIDKNIAAKKKPGYFKSEEEMVRGILNAVGLEPGLRHPLAYIMEACDDIAYSVLDVEDAVKKALVSFNDVVSYLETHAETDPLVKEVVTVARKKHDDYRERNPGLSPAELGDISMQRLRVEAIRVMVNAVRATFCKYETELLTGKFPTPLIENSDAKTLVQFLKKLAKERAYRHRSVLEVELTGYNTLQDLMDMLWFGITDRKEFSKPEDNRSTPFGRYAYSRISENYRRVFENESKLPIAYREAQLLTDMIAGMTDSFAMELHRELKIFRGPDLEDYVEKQKRKRAAED